MFRFLKRSFYFSSRATKFDYLAGAEWSWFKQKNNKQITKLEYLLEILFGCWNQQVGCHVDKNVFCFTELSTRTSYSQTRNISPCLLWNGEALNDRMDSLIPKAFALTSPLTFSKTRESPGLGDHRVECVGLCVPPVESADGFFRL